MTLERESRHACYRVGEYRVLVGRVEKARWQWESDEGLEARPSVWRILGGNMRTPYGGYDQDRMGRMVYHAHAPCVLTSANLHAHVTNENSVIPPIVVI